MRTLVLGGIRSGKSQWAEEAIASVEAQPNPVRYIATGYADAADEAWAGRIAAHRVRRPRTWVTVESGEVAAHLRSNPRSPALVDDIGGWLTGVLDRRGWDGGSIDAEVDELLSAVDAFSAPLTLVSPEVGLTVVPATAAGRRFADELGTLNQRLAGHCDQVVLIIAGQPVWVKRPGADGLR